MNVSHMFARVLLRQQRRLHFPPEQRLTGVIKGRNRTEVVRMATNSDGAGGSDNDRQEVGLAAAETRNPSTYNPKVSRMQDLLANDTLVGWDECWKDGLTPWDLGQPTPVILDLLQKNNLPKGRTLIPGCGSGHDVVAVAGPERYVVGLDISENAVRKAHEHFSSLPNANYFTFLAADFFSWNPDQMFDLIFDYTFFCAIDPSMRSAWAEQIQDILKPDGELITLMFPVEEYKGGPPYASQVSDYEAVLHPLGFKAFSMVDNTLAVGRRKGREKLGRWRRYQSPL